LAQAILESWKNDSKDTIDYIANYLKNHNNTKRNIEKLSNLTTQRNQKIEEDKKNSMELQEQETIKDKINQQIHEKRKAFLDKFKKSESGFENLDSVCEHVGEYAHATGV